MVWRCLYKPHELPIKEMYEHKRAIVLELCTKHLNHRRILHSKRSFDDSLTDSKIIEMFVRSLPVRQATKRAIQAWIIRELKPFIIKPVLDQVEEKQPVEYLTEMRDVTIQFINIVPTTYYVPKLVQMIDEAYKIVCRIVSELLGIVNKVSLFDKDAMMLVLFGLRGIKHEFESQNALKSAYQIRKEINKLDGVKTVSVGVTNGLVYCGVVGHPLRREYTVIGGSVNKAARIMCAYPQKITCDHQTYKNSKLSSAYFQLQSALRLKGIEDAGHIFEYNEEFKDDTHFDNTEPPIIGRQEEMDLIHMIVNHPDHIGGYHGLCIKGKSKIGKSRVLRAAEKACIIEGHAVASTDIACGSPRPYFTVSHLYKNLYDTKSTMDNPESYLISHLPRNLWSFLDISQQSASDIISDKRKYSVMDNFLHMVKVSKTGKTVLIIDNVHYIDLRSWEILEAAMKQSSVKVICAGQFDEEGTWPILFKFSLNKFMKVIEIEPLGVDELPNLICSFLDVDGIPRKLLHMIHKTCEGRPGWIQSCLLRLINTAAIEVTYMKHDNPMLSHYVFVNKPTDPYESIYSRQKDVVCVIELFDRFSEKTEELTLTAISLDLFDSFTPYQQLVIKTAAVLGEVFTRSLIFVMLKYPQEYQFVSTIKHLYEEEVFDCGSRYIQSGGLFSKATACYCHFNAEDFDDTVKKFDFPKYAFCKLIHFKNKSLKAVAYELLPANQKKELHLRITDVLDDQNKACPNCLRDNSSSIIFLRRFKDILKAIGNKEKMNTNPALELKFTCSSESMKDLIREEIHKYTNKEQMLKDTRNIVTPTRKLYDPTICFCLEILTRIYADLVHHSDRAGHLGKKMFFLIQYSKVLIHMNEFKDAIDLLIEAREQFTTNYMQDFVLSESFKHYNIAQIHMLLCEAYIAMHQYDVAKNHVSLALRMYKLPMLSLKYKLAGNILFHGFVLGAEDIRLVNRRKLNSIWYFDVGKCLNMISFIYAIQGHFEMAKIAATKALKMMSVSNPNISLLCDTYSNVVQLYSLLGDSHTCELLERCMNQQVIRLYSHGYTVDMLAINRLISVFFHSKVRSGNIVDSIKLGYRSLEASRVIQAYNLQNDTIPTLATILLFNNRIDDAVHLAKILYVNGKKYDPYAMVSYYAFCLELMLETSFTLEPFEHVKHFADSYFSSGVGFSVTPHENKLILYMILYFLRHRQTSRVEQWRMLYKISTDEKRVHPQNIMNLFKFAELSLEKLMHVKDISSPIPQSELKRAHTILEQCRVACEKCLFMKPRYLHYKAYYYKLKNKKGLVRKILREAVLLARQQGNILEEAWIMLNENCWNGGFKFEVSHLKGINWQLAKTYSLLQWSQIMYALPHNLIVDHF